jgi:hypothetical protein
MSENSAECSEMSMVKMASFGRTHHGLMWKDSEWRNWFRKTEEPFGRSPGTQHWGSRSGHSWGFAKARVKLPLPQNLHPVGKLVSECEGWCLETVTLQATEWAAFNVVVTFCLWPTKHQLLNIRHVVQFELLRTKTWNFGFCNGRGPVDRLDNC